MTTLTRAAQLGGLAKDMLLLKQKPDDARLRAKVVHRLASLRGLPRKVGQVVDTVDLGSSTPSLPELADTGPVLSAAEAARAIRASLGTDPQHLFAEFDPAGIGASIGQVHRARLPDGRAVAVKVKYPDIEGSSHWICRRSSGSRFPSVV